MTHMLLDFKKLKMMRAGLRRELADLQKELDRAQLDHREVLAWQSELSGLAAAGSHGPDPAKLERDLLELQQYEGELRRLIRDLDKSYRDVYSLDRHYESQQRRAQQLSNEKARSSKSASRGALKQPTAQPASKVKTSDQPLPYVRLCISCRRIPASVTGTRTSRLYCQACRPESAASLLFAALKQRRKDLESSISSRWPSQFTGLGMQGGAPGLGKRA